MTPVYLIVIRMSSSVHHPFWIQTSGGLREALGHTSPTGIIIAMASTGDSTDP